MSKDDIYTLRRLANFKEHDLIWYNEDCLVTSVEIDGSYVILHFQDTKGADIKLRGHMAAQYRARKRGV